MVEETEMSFDGSLRLVSAVLAAMVFGFASTEIVAKAAPRSPTVWYGLRLPSSVVEGGLVRSADSADDDAEDILKSHGLSLFSWSLGEQTNGVKDGFELDARRALVQLTSGSIEIASDEVRISGTAEPGSSESIVETLKARMPKGYRLTADIRSSDGAPYVWSALRNSDSIELSGSVPNEGIRRRLVAAAGHLVSDEETNAVLDRLSIRQGEPAGFGEASFAALQQLRTMDQGAVSLTGRKLYVLGQTSSVVRDQQTTCAKIVNYLPKGYSCGFIQLLGVTRQVGHYHHYRAGAGRSQAATPHSVVNPAAVHAAAAFNPDDFERRIVDLLFATNREVDLAGPLPEFTGERSGKLTLGRVRIRVPEDHKAGRLELPRGFSSFWLDLTGDQPDPKVNFTVSSRQILTSQEWDALISELKPNDALIFVHGFNSTFDDAAFRMAQIVWDLQYKGLPVLYSWPSRGETVDYQYDRESALGARSGFIELLHHLREKHGVAHIHVLAHSMGNFLAMDALANEAGTASPVKLSSMIMAAPDVDRDQFIQAVPKIQGICQRMTLYASSADRALALSKTLAGAIPRAGDVPHDGPISLPGLESLDVTALGYEMFGLNHTVFATSRELINDIALLIVDGKSLPRLATERAVPLGSSTPVYWQYVP